VYDHHNTGDFIMTPNIQAALASGSPGDFTMPPNIQAALASASHTIGFLTRYDCRNASVTPSMLKTLFKKHGLDDKYFPDDIKEKNAFQKACRRAMAESGKTSDTRRSIVKLIVDGLDKIVYGVVDLDINESQESIEPDFSDKVWLDKDALTVNFDNGHPTSKLIRDIFNQLCGEYTTRDISRMIVKSLDQMASIPLRDAGVIYFIPVGYEKDLHALQAVVNDVGQCNMRVYALADGDGNASEIQTVAKNQINDKIAAMKADIAELKESIQSNTIKGKTIENSIEVRKLRFKELRERCQILADALRIKADSLTGELDEVSKLIKKDLEDFVNANAA